MNNDDLNELSEILGYSFKDIRILQKAIIHPSVNNKQNDYERMEFLGDSILGFVISNFLYTKYIDADEGVLSKMQSFLVSRKICTIIAKKLNIIDFFIFSSAAENNNERIEDANISNALEVIIAAIYLDGGIENATNFIINNWKDFIDKQNIDYDEDFKTKLQQFSQEKYKILPNYEVVDKNGSDHSPFFTVCVNVLKFSAIGKGKSKKNAEQEAAKQMLINLVIK